MEKQGRAGVVGLAQGPVEPMCSLKEPESPASALGHVAQEAALLVTMPRKQPCWSRWVGSGPGTASLSPTQGPAAGWEPALRFEVG